MTEVTDSDMGFTDKCKFRLDVRIGADSFLELQRQMHEIFKKLTNATTVTAMMRVYGHGSGEDGPRYRVGVKFRDDKETRIKELRAEADKLEVELKQERGIP
jgi:hypothetical protein